MPLIPIEINKEKQINKVESNIDNLKFKDLNVKENNVEEFIRQNLDEVFDEDETLLIIGQQVINKENGRSDLVAIDKEGNFVLIEIKRDEEDIKARKEPFEFQAIRYAANYAKIKTVDDAVDKIFSHYIEKHKNEFSLGDFTTNEYGNKKLLEFLRQNGSEKTFNKKQRIILIASSFDAQTKSAVAWLIINGIDISCFKIYPKKINSNIYISVEKELPLPDIEDYFVDVKTKDKKKYTDYNTKIQRAYLPRMDKLIENKIVKSGDRLFIKGYKEDNFVATLIDEKYVNYNGKKITLNEWGREITNWSAVNMYENVILESANKTLDELRKESID